MHGFFSMLTAGCLVMTTCLVLAGCGDQEAKKELEKILAKDARAMKAQIDLWQSTKSLWPYEKELIALAHSKRIEGQNIMKKGLMPRTGKSKEELMKLIVELDAKIEAENLASQAYVKASEEYMRCDEEYMRCLVDVAREKEKGDARKLLATLQAKQAAKDAVWAARDAAKLAQEQAGKDVEKLNADLMAKAYASVDALRAGR